MFIRVACLALLATAAASTASAGIVIDDFEFYDSSLGADPGYGFDPVNAYKYPSYQKLDAAGTSSNGMIVGGSRDVKVHVVNAVGYATDNDQISAVAGNGRFNGDGYGGMGIGAGGEASFAYTYDGAGVGGAATGLNLNLAATGNRINLTLPFVASIVSTPTQIVPLTVVLTDISGRTSSLTRYADATGYQYNQSLDFQFSQFEAANALFDITHVNRITVGSQYKSASYFDASIEIGGIITAGSAYSPTNRVPAATPVPEPATWAMMIGGFAMVGAAMRRRVAARTILAS